MKLIVMILTQKLTHRQAKSAIISTSRNSEIDEGATNPYYQDVDGDGFGLNSIGPVMTCSPLRFVSNNQDLTTLIHQFILELQK